MLGAAALSEVATGARPVAACDPAPEAAAVPTLERAPAPTAVPLGDVLTASDFWGGAGSAACQGFITQLGRNFQVIYEQANAHGQKVQAAGNNMAQTDSAVGSSWA